MSKFKIVSTVAKLMIAVLILHLSMSWMVASGDGMGGQKFDQKVKPLSSSCRGKDDKKWGCFRNLQPAMMVFQVSTIAKHVLHVAFALHICSFLEYIHSLIFKKEDYMGLARFFQGIKEKKIKGEIFFKGTRIKKEKIHGIYHFVKSC